MSFELDQGHMVERLAYSAVVELIDVLGRLLFDVLDVAPGSLAVDQFGLLEAVETFGQRIVIRITLGPYRGDDLGFAQSLGVAS